MNICFIPNLGVKRSADEPKWGADFFAEAFQKYIPYNVTVEHSLDNINNYDMVWVHNIANLLKGFSGRVKTFHKLIRYHPPMIGGVRGKIGLKTARMYLGFFDAIHTSNDNLTYKVKPHNSHVITLCSGVEPDWYTPHPQPEGFCVGWAGDSAKNMKNTELIAGLLTPARWATKENYIPNNEMPEKFYHKINALIHPSGHEGSCRVITEAAACGLPIICTNVGHNSTIVDPDWMITLDNDPQAQIKSLLDKLKADPILAQEVGQQNQDRAQNYSWSKVIGRANALINKVMQVDLVPAIVSHVKPVLIEVPQ